jgi:hypothetical protein
VATATTTSPNNFEVGRCFLNSVVSVRFHLSLTGLGGEEREWKAAATRRSGGSEGVSALACMRGAGWWLALPSPSSVSLSAYLAGEGRRGSMEGQASITLILKRR